MTTIDGIESLFRSHFAAMHRVAMLMLRDDGMARDIVHDVFETLLATGNSEVSEVYLLRAVRNRCLNHIRNLSARERLKEMYSLSEQQIDAEEWPDEATITLIQSTLSSALTEACRRVVELRFTDGLSYQEIADTLGISKVAVYKHLRHAIDVLRQKLSQNG